MQKILAATHLTMMMAGYFYFLVPKSGFDFVYLASIYCVYLLWTLLSGRCLFTVLTLKEKAGEEATDVYELFSAQHYQAVKTVLKVASLAFPVSLFVVVRRNGMSVVGWLAPLAAYCLAFKFRNERVDHVFSVVFALGFLWLSWRAALWVFSLVFGP